MYAKAYNALGTVQNQAGNTKDALLAFLHVDVLYSNYPRMHAESLYHLTSLWDKLNEGERSMQCRQMLKSRYGNSPWAKNLAN